MVIREVCEEDTPLLNPPYLKPTPALLLQYMLLQSVVVVVDPILILYTNHSMSTGIMTQCAFKIHKVLYLFINS